MPLPRLLVLLLAFTTAVLVPSKTWAQSEWSIKVKPPTAPVPIGSCAAVTLQINVTTGEIPRNPAGDRVTIADFDMEVTSAAGVASYWLDPYHWYVCSCQAGTVGAVAGITATYPAKALAASRLVPGVNAQGSGAFSVGKRDGVLQPPSCVAQATKIALGPSKVLSGTPVGGLPRQARAPVATAPAIPKPIAPQPIVGGTLAPDPAPTRPPAVTTAGTPIATSTNPPRTVSLTGLAPTGLRVVTSVPIVATLEWDTMPNGVTYTLRRAVGAAASVERVKLDQAAPKTFIDVVPDPRDTYRYTLVVTYADGTWGTSAPVEFVSPPLRNPSGFSAKDQGQGNVDFQWQPVAGAVRYRLDGPGISGSGYYTNVTSTVYPKVPAGANSWKLTALYQGNFADYANPSTASAVIRVLPPHATPWLSKYGAGSPQTVQMPLYYDSCDPTKREIAKLFNVQEAKWLGVFATWDCSRSTPGLGLWYWTQIRMPLWGDSEQFNTEAVYGNAIDIGVGRRTDCAQASLPAPFGVSTTCYAAAHGIIPGEPGFNDSKTITQPGEGIGEDFILAMVIQKDLTGTTFMVFLKDTLSPEAIRSQSLSQYRRLSDKVSLDTEGPKYLPHVCMACHGGKYNTLTRKVDGASFLPLDPGLLEFASPVAQAGQEETFRTINNMIVASEPRSAVADYIRGLYGNAVSVPGTLAKVDYVPQSWSQQSGFYRSLVKPHCATCHLAAPSSWNFASWDNFKENAALIRVAVCNSHTMPHSELQFKAFWTKDTGPIYTPGLLATTLGFSSCP